MVNKFPLTRNSGLAVKQNAQLKSILTYYKSSKIYQIYRENTDFNFTMGFHPIVSYPSAILLGHPSIYIYVSEGLF